MSRLLEVKITSISTTPDVITTEDAKEYCRVDFMEDDSLFQQLIASSRERLQKYTCRVFLKANCSAYYRQECGGDRILLSYSDNIVLDASSPYTGLLMGESIIKTEDQDVFLEYEAGYEADQVPEWMQQAVLIDVAYRYENRGDIGANAGINAELVEYLKPFVNWSIL